MQTTQKVFSTKEELLKGLNKEDISANQLHFIFADKKYFADEEVQTFIQNTFKGAVIAGCSTAGEVGDGKVMDGTFVLTSVKLENTRIKKSCFTLGETKDSFKAGEFLAKELSSPDLKHVFVLSDGLVVNGSRLVEGLNSVINESINISGGLAGDNGDFIKTYVADLNNRFVSHCVSAFGFYGDHVLTSAGSFGGWDSFGLDRKVTKSVENVVYEIDGKPALELYKSYLGDLSSQLPGSALFFPLEMIESENTEQVVRTILGVNEAENSLTFAGNIPEGSFVKLMKTNMNRVIEGAEKAAGLLGDDMRDSAELVLMVSCVGRKLVLKQLTQDEVEAVTDNFNNNAMFTGFYSYGEISKRKFQSDCKLHNQTMTVTAIKES